MGFLVSMILQPGMVWCSAFICREGFNNNFLFALVGSLVESQIFICFLFLSFSLRMTIVIILLLNNVMVKLQIVYHGRDLQCTWTLISNAM